MKISITRNKTLVSIAIVCQTEHRCISTHSTITHVTNIVKINHTTRAPHHPMSNTQRLTANTCLKLTGRVIGKRESIITIE